NNNPGAAAGGVGVPIAVPAGGGMMGMPGGIAGTGDVQSGLMPGSGMRSIPVNGYFYALDRKTGKVNWHSHVPHQTVVLEHFREMPVVMFTARPFADMGRGMKNVNMQVTSFKSIDKKTGKLLLDEGEISNNVMFYSLNMDLRAGRIELVGQNVKIVHYLNEAAAAAKDKPATQPQSGPAGGASTGTRVRRAVAPEEARVQVIEKK